MDIQIDENALLGSMSGDVTGDVAEAQAATDDATEKPDFDPTQPNEEDKEIVLNKYQIRKMLKAGIIKREPAKIHDMAILEDVRIEEATCVPLDRDVVMVHPNSRLEMENTIKAKGFGIKQLTRQQKRQYSRTAEKLIQKKLREKKGVS